MVCAAAALCGSAETWSVDFATLPDGVTAASVNVGATATAIDYGTAKLTLFNAKIGAYQSATYLQLTGKDVNNNKGYIILPASTFAAKSIALKTGKNASTNVAINITAGTDTIIVAKKMGAQNSTFTIAIPEAAQKVGAAYKIEVSATTNYNAQFQSITLSSEEAAAEPEKPAVVTDHKGTAEDPYSISDVIKLNNDKTGKSYVKGYIVGEVNNNKAVWANFTNGSNILLADSANVTDMTRCVPVQLSANSTPRAEYNLVNNPWMQGQEITVEGSLVAYYSQPGVKSLTNSVSLADEQTWAKAAFAWYGKLNDIDEYSIKWYNSQIDECTTVEEVIAAYEENMGLAGLSLTEPFTMGNVYLKLNNIAPVANDSTTTWAAGEFGTLANMWTGHMNMSFGPSPWNDDEIAVDDDFGVEVGDDEPAESENHSDQAFRLQNSISGLYIGKAVDGKFTATTEEAEATYFEIIPVNGIYAIATEADHSVFVSADSTGIISSTIPVAYTLETAATDHTNAPMVGIPGVEFDESGDPMEPITEVKSISVTIPEGFKPTGMGKIEFYTTIEDMETWDYTNVTIAEWTSEALTNGTEVEWTTTVWVETDEKDEYGWPKYAKVEISHKGIQYELPLRNVISAAGEYHIEMEAYMFAKTDSTGTVYSSLAASYFEIEGAGAEAEYFALDVTPTAGKVETLTTITITTATPDDGIGVNWNGSNKITLINDENPTVGFEFTKDDVQNALDPDPDWVRPANTYILKVDLSVAGNYTLTIPAGFFDNDSMNYSEETIIKWEVEKAEGSGTENGISEINAETAIKAYDLQGRRVATPTKGLYIINGTKTIVK